MKTQRNMNPRRSLFSRIVVLILVGSIASLVWSGTCARAATAESTLKIPVLGTVIEPDGTTIAVGGWVTVTGTLVTDADEASPDVILAFDFSHVSGSSKTGRKTVTYVTGEDQSVKIRPLQASDTIPISCPYFEKKSGVSSANAWLVTTTLIFDLSTGKLASGWATVGNDAP